MKRGLCRLRSRSPNSARNLLGSTANVNSRTLNPFHPHPPAQHTVSTVTRRHLLLPPTLLRTQSSIHSACTSRSQFMCSNLQPTTNVNWRFMCSNLQPTTTVNWRFMCSNPHLQAPLICQMQKRTCLPIGRCFSHHPWHRSVPQVTSNLRSENCFELCCNLKVISVNAVSHEVTFV
jgi:hypothetical protein